jgi:hypothetical protein
MAQSRRFFFTEAGNTSTTKWFPRKYKEEQGEEIGKRVQKEIKRVK